MRVYLVWGGDRYEPDLLGVVKTYERAKQLIDDEIEQQRQYGKKIEIQRAFVDEEGVYYIEAKSSYVDENDVFDDVYYIEGRELLE